jgi:hypothetical protein
MAVKSLYRSLKNLWNQISYYHGRHGRVL